MEKVHFVSLGCPKNLVDAEIMVGSLVKDGRYQICNEVEEAQTVVINTCSFIESSKRESISKILEFVDLKEKGLIQRVVVTGCLVQRYKDELVKELPEVDVFIGTGEFQKIPEILEINRENPEKKNFYHLPTFLQKEDTPRIVSGFSHRAFLKISEGCLKRCAFCAIPAIRGNLQSRSLKSIVAEAKLLAASGVKELIVVSHDFTDYGWDLRRKNPESIESPLSLLEALDEVEGVKWIRLMYLYPDGIDEKIIQVVKNSKKICPYFDMPLQHANNEMLKAMNRKMTKEQILNVLNMIRRELPEAVIRTQFIVGYPGETEEQFEEILELMETQRFDRVGCFEYSPEEGTPGGRRKDQVDPKVKKRRYREVMKTQQKISLEKNRKMIGRVLTTVIEGYSEETELLLQGRHFGQAPEIDGVVLINDGCGNIGDFVEVEITDALEYDLIGRILPTH